jgi:hypothetical protein
MPSFRRSGRARSNENQADLQTHPQAPTPPPRGHDSSWVRIGVVATVIATVLTAIALTRRSDPPSRAPCVPSLTNNGSFTVQGTLTLHCGP